MKKLIASLTLILASCSCAHAGTPETMFYDITPQVTIYLTDDPCLMWTPKVNDPTILHKAYAYDGATDAHADGCWTRNLETHQVEIQLVNPDNNNKYGFIIREEVFQPLSNL